MNNSSSYTELSDEQLRTIDAVCETFELAIRIDEPISIESCLSPASPEIRTSLFRELLAIEFEWHFSRGTKPQIAEYLARFPDCRDDIELQFRELPEFNAPMDRNPSCSVSDHGNGTLIAGRYRLDEVIGEGGMGTVYRANQTEPIRRLVALKLIKSGMNSQAVLARFEAERQALALMDHPNIAHVYDGGTTDAGKPFFVMELVGGVPITQYCDEHRLNVKARLELFTTVCEAVQHAHQKGIIHRDLKPGNVLVTEIDGRPIPKIIDFGVAKAIEQKLTDQSLADTLAIVGTPAYMSPEQADPSSMDIDTRTDIYALGVILYELLVGSPPIEVEQFQRGAALEMLRMVREVDPPRPSTRLSSATGRPSIAANRNIEPAQLAKLLRNELDWIVLKALEKDRTRRYETANSFARDIRRFLVDEIVEARSPSAGYRVRKFVKRHRSQVIAAGLIVITLLAGMIGTTWSLLEARRHEQSARAEAAEKEKARTDEAKERGYAEAIADFVQNDFFALTSVEGQLRFDDEKRMLSKDSTLRDLLDRAARKLDERTDLNPRTEAKLRWMIGVNYRGLGDFQRSVPHLERSVALNLSTFGQDDSRTLTAQNSLSAAYLSAGLQEKAVLLSEQTLTILKTRLGPEHRATLDGMRVLAAAYRKSGQAEKALPLLEQALDITRRTAGPESLDTMTTMYYLALTCQAAGQPKRALRLMEQTHALQLTRLGLEHSDTHTSMNVLAGYYRDDGQVKKALPLLVQGLEWSKTKYGPEHPETIIAMGGLAAGYRDAGQLDKAIAIMEQTLKLQKEQLGLKHPDTLGGMNELAMIYRAAGKLDKALPLFEEALELKKDTLGLRHLSTLTGMQNLAWAYRATGQQSKALPLNEQALELSKDILGPNHPMTLTSMHNLAVGYRTAGQLDKSTPLFEETLKQREAQFGRRHAETLLTAANLGANYKDADRVAEALPLLEEAHIAAKEFPTLRIVGLHLLDGYAKAGKTEQVISLANVLLTETRATVPVESLQLAGQLGSIGLSLFQVKAFSEAEPLLRECLAIRERTEPDAWRTFQTKSMLGGSLLGLKKYAAAEPLLLAGYAGMKQREKAIPPQSQVRFRESIDRVIELYTAMNKHDDVKKWQRLRTEFPKQ